MRYRPNRIQFWADRYDYREDDQLAVEIGHLARDRGYLDKDAFVELCRWKSPRTKSLCDSNDGALINEATKISLSAQHERVRIGSLLTLEGVGYPMASMILHFCHRDPYPILDYRTIWSLSAEVPYAYTFDFWWRYVVYCRGLAQRHHGDMRTLDRALWQYSNENQAPQ